VEHPGSGPLTQGVPRVATVDALNDAVGGPSESTPRASEEANIGATKQESEISHSHGSTCNLRVSASKVDENRWHAHSYQLASAANSRNASPKYGGRRKGARNRIAKLAGSRMIDAHGEQGDLQSWRQPFPTRAFAVGTPDATSSYFDSADDFPAAAEAGKSALTAP